MSIDIANPIRLIDIARKVGVSRIAVAKVLHDGGGKNTRVSDETAEKIRKIASELNYRPNLAARQLTGASSRLIGAIIDSFASDAGRAMLMTIEQAVAQHGYRLLVGFMHEDITRIKSYIDDFQGHGVEGVISMAHTYPGLSDKIPAMFNTFKHCVFIDKPHVDTPFSSVDIDVEYAGYLLTSHLLKLGRRRIVLSSLNYQVPTIYNRELGYMRAYREMGLTVDTTLIYKGTLLYIQSLEAANSCLDGILRARPDAIIAGSDEVAIWFIHALNKRGIRVPEDCSIVSMEYMQACRGFMPVLTTAYIDYDEVARKAIDILFNNIKTYAEHRADKQNIVIKPKLFIGQSCSKNKTSFRENACLC
jgi:DNA-binding LacI/PurR family transcriptional regulator